MDRLGIITIHKCQGAPKPALFLILALRGLARLGRSAWVTSLIPLFAMIRRRQCNSLVKLNAVTAD